MKQDSNSYQQPFKPRARLLQLLGDQLIGTSRLAVFELVKNAYDADAENITVTLKDLETANPSIIVEDDGDGMPLKTILDIWLVPAHDHREKQRKELRRSRLGRLPLGEKGLGRFAAHKLGDCIELVTRANGQPECVVAIDWSKMIEKEFLSDAMVTVSSREPQIFRNQKKGTRITINKLRETSWTRGEVRRLQRQITSIASPFTDRSDSFTAVLEVPEHPDWIEGIPDTQILLNRAPWYFKFIFGEEGFKWKYQFRGVTGIKLNSRQKEEKSGTLLLAQERDIGGYGINQNTESIKSRKIVADAEVLEGIGTVVGEFYVFDRDREIVSRFGDSQLLLNFLDENGGVRLYRDNIRVYNYGEPGDDWLGLDLRRVNMPSRNISRNIVVGTIDLSLNSSWQLTEKTNREGFVENDAYHRLRKIILGAVSILETERKIDKSNIRFLTGKGKDAEITNIKKPLHELRTIARKHHLSQELEPFIRKAENNYDEMRETMLRAGMSGIGLAIVFHEIERGVRILYDAIEKGQSLELVQTQARELVRVLDGFSDLLRKGDRRSNSLRTLVTRVRDINRVRLRKHKVHLVCPALEEDFPDIKKEYTFGLLLGALNNLLDNAFYWLKVRWPVKQEAVQRRLYINIEPDFEGRTAIIVADNGPGFQDEPEQLSRPFFSRRPDGMGIGLYYTNMAMELNNGWLAFPEADEANIPEEFDGAILALVFDKGGRK